MYSGVANIRWLTNQLNSASIEYISQQWLNMPGMVKSIIAHYYNVAKLDSSTSIGPVNL